MSNNEMNNPKTPLLINAIMRKQHAGFNAHIVPVLPEEKTQLEVEMFQLMNCIDGIDMGRDTSQYGKVTIEAYVLPRQTYNFYLKWLMQCWYYHGVTVTIDEIVNALRMFCVTLIVRV